MPENARQPEQFELFDPPKKKKQENPSVQQKRSEGPEMKIVESKEAPNWKTAFDLAYSAFDRGFDRADDQSRPTDVFVRNEGYLLVDALPKDHALREALQEAVKLADSGRVYAIVAQIQKTTH